MDEREAMNRALDLAWRGWGRVHPNPLVGAVVLAGGGVVGRGMARGVRRPPRGAARARSGRRARARRDARRDARAVRSPGQAAAVHRGHHPRRASGASWPRWPIPIRRPAAARPGSGRWASRCRSASPGEAAAAQNAIFLHRFRNPSRPFVALKLATSLDGRIADCLRSLALDLGRAGAGLRALAPRRLRRDRRRRPDRAARRSPAHRARHRDPAGPAAPGDLRRGRPISIPGSRWSGRRARRRPSS